MRARSIEKITVITVSSRYRSSPLLCPFVLFLTAAPSSSVKNRPLGFLTEIELTQPLTRTIRAQKCKTKDSKPVPQSNCTTSAHLGMPVIDSSIVASAIGALVDRPVLTYDDYCRSRSSMHDYESLDMKAFHTTSLVGHNERPD